MVVGIAWVVECAEQCKRVDEERFLISLDGVNVAGTQKVRSQFPCASRPIADTLDLFAAKALDAAQEISYTARHRCGRGYAGCVA